MSQLWVWALDSYSCEKQIETDLLLSDNDENYGGGYDYDELEPIRRVTLTCSGMTFDEFMELEENMLTRGETYEAPDNEGRTWTGRLTSVGGKNIVGSIYYDVTISIKLPQTTP